MSIKKVWVHWPITHSKSIKKYIDLFFSWFFWLVLRIHIPSNTIPIKKHHICLKKWVHWPITHLKTIMKFFIDVLFNFWLVLRIPKSIQKRKWYQNMYISHQMRVAVAGIKDGAVRLKFRHFWKIWQIELYRQEI